MFARSFLEPHARLLQEINDGNVRGVEEQLDAGANVNGLSPDYVPIHVAARCGHTKVVEMLARRGANLEAAVSRDVPNGFGGQALPKGARALHAAVMSGEPGTVQALLGADPNPREGEGNTPLILAVIIRHEESLEMVRLLLSRGADPLLANRNGIDGLTPMHHAAGRGSTEMVDMIVAAVPAALNVGSSTNGITPLGLAVDVFVLSPAERERMVGHLLSLGATDKDVPNKEASALVKAACEGNERMVRMMLDAAAGRRVEQFWGTEAVSRAIFMAAGVGLARIVHMLVTAEGEERQQHWARARVCGMAALFRATAFCSVPTLGVLLAAGADELDRNHRGHRPIDCAGIGLPADDVDAGSKTSAVRRTLRRAPAFRARSWAWPAVEAMSAQGGGAAATASGDLRDESSPKSMFVRIFRPRNPRFFTTRFDRYSRKR